MRNLRCETYCIMYIMCVLLHHGGCTDVLSVYSYRKGNGKMVALRIFGWVCVTKTTHGSESANGFDREVNCVHAYRLYREHF
jgi:hypothetical protein